MDDEIRDARTDMTVTIQNLTLPQAAALKAMFDRMEQLGGLGGSRWVQFFADGDGNFHPHPTYQFSSHGELVKEWSEGECAWSDEADAFSVDFDTIAWKRHHG